MVYDFSSYTTHAGRVVRFVIDRAELKRAIAAAPAVAERIIVESVATAAGSELIMTPSGALELCDALAKVGGDAAVADRMLRAHVEGLLAEVRAARSCRSSNTEPTSGTTRERREVRAGAA